MATWLAVIATAFLVGETMCFSLVVDAQYKILPPGKVIERFLCQADVPLTGCQVKTFVNKVIYDLSNSNSSNYWGTGLENGQCGYSRENSRSADVYTPYGCRARAHDGAWEYETIVREFQNSISALPLLTVPPRSVIADPGRHATIAFAAGEPLSECWFRSNNGNWTSSGSSEVFKVDDSKLAQGLCSLTLLNVKPETSGIVTSFVRSEMINGTIRYHKQLTTLIVKMAPTAPALSINKEGVFNEGDVMAVSCNVGPTRPVARITWLLNYDVIQGETPDYDMWPWEYEAANITWKLSRKLSMDDDGKVLVCRVHHIALPRGVVDARRKITVRKMVATEESDLAFLASPGGKWLMVGIGGSLLVVAVVVAALLIYARVVGKWCFARPGNGGNRKSVIYDDTFDIALAPANAPRPVTPEYIEVF